MKPVFKFRDGCHLAGDAQIVGERLESIKRKSNMLTPALVVEDAKNISSPLHGFFEWDDTLAAEKYRIDQAGHLVRSVVVTFEDSVQLQNRQVCLSGMPSPEIETARTIRAFLPIKDDSGGNSYVSSREALGNPEMRRQVLARAYAELASVGKKYRELQELSGVFDALEQVELQLREPTAA